MKPLRDQKAENDRLRAELRATQAERDRAQQACEQIATRQDGITNPFAWS